MSLSRWQPGPARQTSRLAHVFTGAFAADHCPPRLLAINALTSSVGAMRPCSLCPSHPFTPPRLPEPSHCRLRHHHHHGELVDACRPSSLPPPRAPIKGIARAPPSPHQPRLPPPPSPRARLSQHRRALPSLR
jgi:hypothetical protein